MNLYTYCYNNPCRYEDSSGNFGVIAFTIIGAAVGGVYRGYKSYKETGKINWREVGKSTLKGAVSGLEAYGIVGGITVVGSVLKGGSWVGQAIATTAEGIEIELEISGAGTVAAVAGVGAIYNATSNKGGTNSWKRNLSDVGELDSNQFKNLKNNGVVKVNSSGSDRPLTGKPNSYYSTGNGEHVFVYDENGKLIYDISELRVKSFKINVDPRGVEHYQAYKLKGAVPQSIKNIFGW